ncbi:MAG TPA: hypothetical protein PKY96_05410 [Flavobacteriales bacterium]|nr:hypothetical protein [Flavobacteriales bacterium]
MHQAIQNPVLRFMVHGHLVLALGAAAQVWWIGEEWFVEWSLIRSAVAFFATFACYGLLRLVRSREEGLGDVPLFAWYLAHQKAMLIAVVVSALLALMALGAEVLEALSRLWLVVVPALLYVVPLRGKDGRLHGLRRIPALKSFLVAWVWAAGTVLLAADGAQGMAWLLLIVFFCFYLALAIAFDLRDARVDPLSLRTVPQLLGQRAAKAMALLLLLPLVVLLYASLFFSGIRGDAGARPDTDWTLALPLIGLAMPAWFILRSNPKRGWFHWLLLDACIALLPVLAWVGSCL